MLAHLIIRTVYSPSELESMRIMEENGDYYLEINSPAKQLRETSKNRQFKERSEELQKAKDSLTKKDRRNSESRAKLVCAMPSRE